ncbi:MAG: hypothetical protein PHS02_04250 [Candidatus ainarchaeum sp.]|nr:hypothetical protein [Candidatus ainarchaeum sp.]
MANSLEENEYMKKFENFIRGIAGKIPSESVSLWFYAYFNPLKA